MEKGRSKGREAGPRGLAALRRKLTDTFELPMEITLDVPKVTLVGDLHLTIENHRGIIHFSEDRVVVGVSKGQVEVRGCNLSIGHILTDEVFLVGEIRSVALIRA